MPKEWVHVTFLENSSRVRLKLNVKHPKQTIVVKVHIKPISFIFLPIKTLYSDEDGTPYCCGGSIPDEYASQYGGYGDNSWFDGTESIHQL